VTPEGVRQGGEALLPYVTKMFLERRLRLKKLIKNYPEGSAEYNFCEGRQGALKSILVYLYGTSGCCWNRLGNVLCFEEINRRSREALTAAMHCAQEMVFEVVYGDTDSLFVKRKGATKEDYDGLALEIKSRTGLPISLDHHYKFLILLPLESDPTGSMEAQKHYFGVLTNGELVARGIEMRRHDTPRFIMEFQSDLILALFSGESCEEVRTEGYAKARELISESIRRIMDGDVPARDLAVSKVLRRPIQTYARAIAHVSAAIRLAERGKTVKEGEVIDFVHVDAKNHNPEGSLKGGL
jgi:DNA polymerase elongation subunit (family B)